MKSATKTSVAWLSAEQAALHLGFVDAAGQPEMRRFYKFLQRHKPKAHRLGRSLRFRQVDLDACVEAEPEKKAGALTLLAGGRAR